MTQETLLSSDLLPLSSFDLDEAIKLQGEQFQECYLWLERAMPPLFFQEVSKENLILVTHRLMDFPFQEAFCTIHRKSKAIVLSLETRDADVRILRLFPFYGVEYYQTYVSKEALPFPGMASFLRIAVIDFTEASEENHRNEHNKRLLALLKLKNFPLTQGQLECCLAEMSRRFLFAVPSNIVPLAIDLFFRAKAFGHCQCEGLHEEDWEQKESPSTWVVLACRNAPKHNFLYCLARIVDRHGLRIRRVNATYSSNGERILVMALHLHGSHGQAVSDVADLLREISSVKLFETFDKIDESLVTPGIISGNMGNLLRAMSTFIHQALVNLDPNLYTIENVEEALCRHPKLTMQLCQAFQLRFDSTHCHVDQFAEARQTFLSDVAQLDTGLEANDTRRKTILRQGMNFITYTLKTNVYSLNSTAFSFRLDPHYLNEIPFDRVKTFPALPYAIFFIQGMSFFAFHIRFKELSRGGVRTIYPEDVEHSVAERNHVFRECYHLALTQHRKNKDIPEGGAKGVIFLQPFSQIDIELPILKRELERLNLDAHEIERRVNAFRQEQKLESLHQSQRAFVDSLVTIVNDDGEGNLRAPGIIDYWKRPEYIYLGPDENMHDAIIEWIADFSQKQRYKPARALISSKRLTGINHKEYGVTSLGINVYMHKVLEYMGIHPETDPFTIKMTGGPDGDVAGNQLLHLYHFYPRTAKVVALTDGTGTIRDAQGLDLAILKELFSERKGICFYPPHTLSPGSFLVNKSVHRHSSNYVQETLCSHKKGDQVLEKWLSGDEAHHLLRLNVHQMQADIFIPAGGRPCTLRETNVQEFLDSTGQPTSRAIIEGANLYLNDPARSFLEERGVLIVKDSSANKGGVICSSFEVLCGLVLDDETFIQHKPSLVSEILQRIKQCASDEATLLLRTHQCTGESLTSLTDRISERINQYADHFLNHLDSVPLSTHCEDPLIRTFLNYCLPTLRDQFAPALLQSIPDHHKKAIISCSLATRLVYTHFTSRMGCGESESACDSIMPPYDKYEGIFYH